MPDPGRPTAQVGNFMAQLSMVITTTLELAVWEFMRRRPVLAVGVCAMQPADLDVWRGLAG